ncbi:hypothetical protein TRFO_30046 [Tritrichomonas foetus]|uniref:Uncharacterized protein n=1 Tax=Tritrichomonas foetus TaxID=1144522 RepID=A0A1J4JVI1_9EUKA|nr:hypothetical protein TRFO_30046 [Tritrichomonas foetus]|eukprot:OHT02738.1 hypothetical protein TRFO_30046 [Tritrichomonas foetus]
MSSSSSSSTSSRSSRTPTPVHTKAGSSEENVFLGNCKTKFMNFLIHPRTFPVFVGISIFFLSVIASFALPVTILTPAAECKCRGLNNPYFNGTDCTELPERPVNSTEYISYIRNLESIENKTVEEFRQTLPQEYTNEEVLYVLYEAKYFTQHGLIRSCYVPENTCGYKGATVVLFVISAAIAAVSFYLSHH